MSREYRISELLMNNETPFYEDSEELKKYRKVKKVENNGQTRYLTWVDDKNMVSIKNPEGRELTPEELFDFIIGNNITDLARTKDLEGRTADIAIVLGNHTLPVTRERAIKAFELYRKGIVKKIIFTGCVSERDKPKDAMNPKTMEEYMDKEIPDLEWKDIGQGDWGAETFIPEVFDKDYKKHSKMLTEEFLKSIKINPEDIISETMSTSTQENALFAKNFMEQEKIETGLEVRKAILVTTITHGARAMRQFQKLFGDSIELAWCPATLDLEQDEKIKGILHAEEFDEEAFRRELKRIYCSDPVLIKKLMEETANHRNAFILGDIYEPTITTIDEPKDNSDLEH